jgi:hypothetical protein
MFGIKRDFKSHHSRAADAGAAWCAGIAGGRDAPSPRLSVAIRNETASRIATVSATATSTVDLIRAALFPLVFMANDFMVDPACDAGHRALPRKTAKGLRKMRAWLLKPESASRD